MTDDVSDVWSRDEVDSPCVKICMIDPGSGICIGCHRTADEIAQWSRFSAAERSAVKEELAGRASLLRNRSTRPSRRRNRVRGAS
ncbi:MAG: DUF1289 domain-containing protein [Pseudomonadota bacterium]